MNQQQKIRLGYHLSRGFWCVVVILYFTSFFTAAHMDFIGFWYSGSLIVEAALFFLGDSIAREKAYRTSGLFSLYELPKGIKIMFLVSLGVAAVSVAICMLWLLKDGAPKVVADGYWIINHGERIRPLTSQEYSVLTRAEACMWTALPLIFASTNYAYFGKELHWEKVSKK